MLALIVLAAAQFPGPLFPTTSPGECPQCCVCAIPIFFKCGCGNQCQSTFTPFQPWKCANSANSLASSSEDTLPALDASEEAGGLSHPEDSEVAPAHGLTTTTTTTWPLILDVRTDEEWAAGHVSCAVHLPYDAPDFATIVERLAHGFGLRKSDAIALYCRSGVRAGKALEKLAAAGFTSLTNMGGFEESRDKLEASCHAGEADEVVPTLAAAPGDESCPACCQCQLGGCGCQTAGEDADQCRWGAESGWSCQSPNMMI